MEARGSESYQSFCLHLTLEYFALKPTSDGKSRPRPQVARTNPLTQIERAGEHRVVPGGIAATCQKGPPAAAKIPPLNSELSRGSHWSLYTKAPVHSAAGLSRKPGPINGGDGCGLRKEVAACLSKSKQDRKKESKRFLTIGTADLPTVAAPPSLQPGTLMP